MNQRKNLFVVGVGRSGTSLLQAMLASHNALEFIPETGVLRGYVFQSKLAKLCQVSGVEAVKRVVESDNRLKRVEHLSATLDSLLFDEQITSNLDRQLYNRLFVDPTATYSGDKDPKLVEHIDQLLQLWPQCKIIHLYRDPRDVLASKQKAAWSVSKSNFKQLVAGVAQIKLALRAQKHYSADRLCFIKYEDLVQQPSETIQVICKWLDVPFDENTLNHTGNAKHLVSGDEMQWKSEVLQPIIPTNFGKWVSRLSPLEAVCTEFSCVEAMNLGAYEPVANITVSRLAYASVYSKLVRLFALAYVHYRLISNRSQHGSL